MKYTVGKEYKVRFQDHVEDSKEPMEFIVYGTCLKASRSYFVIGCWVDADNPGSDPVNEKVFTILKKAVVKAEEML